MDAPQSTGQQAEPAAPTIQFVWEVAAQVLVIALLILLLSWGRVPVYDGEGLVVGYHAPALWHQVFLLIVSAGGLVAALLALHPRFASAPWAAWSSGILLAGAAWLTVANRADTDRFVATWDRPWLDPAGVPLALVPVAVVAVLVAASSVFLRRAPRTAAALPSAALLAGLGAVLIATAFYVRINAFADLSSLYGVERYQFIETLSAAVLYPLAVWLGAAVVRGHARFWILPALAPAIVLLFFVIWGRMGGA